MMYNNDIGVWDFPAQFSENSQQWGSSLRFDRNTQESMTPGMYEMSPSPQIMDKINGLCQKIDALTASEPYPQHPFMFCGICSNPTHPTYSCPYNTPYHELREDPNTIQNFHRPSHNNSYFDNNNPDWARHHNYSWSEGSHLGSSMDFSHHSAPYPSYPQPPEQPHKPSLEDTLQMLMESTRQIQQSHLGEPLDFTHYSAPHSQYPPPFEQPHKPSLEDTLQSFIQSTRQF